MDQTEFPGFILPAKNKDHVSTSRTYPIDAYEKGELFFTEEDYQEFIEESLFKSEMYKADIIQDLLNAVEDNISATFAEANPTDYANLSTLRLTLINLIQVNKDYFAVQGASEDSNINDPGDAAIHWLAWYEVQIDFQNGRYDSLINMLEFQVRLRLDDAVKDYALRYSTMEQVEYMVKLDNYTAHDNSGFFIYNVDKETYKIAKGLSNIVQILKRLEHTK